jgi:mannose-6-phosphate isomerase-like protein (cupin superfamily)
MSLPFLQNRLYLRHQALTSKPCCWLLAPQSTRQYNGFEMAEIEKLNVAQAAAKLDKPFSMINIASVGDIVVSVYICQGMLEWHRHLDNDELFWVYEGTILLESDWGEVRLRPGELAVVPKGVEHRSSSGLRASVLLLRCGVAPGRKNGRRRLYGLGGEGQLSRVSLHSAIQTLTTPLQFQTVAQVEDSVVEVAWGEGTWPAEMPAPHDMLFFVLNGTATVRVPETMLHLHPGDLSVVPRDAIYQLSTTKGTALVRVTRGKA